MFTIQHGYDSNEGTLKMSIDIRKSLGRNGIH